MELVNDITLHNKHENNLFTIQSFYLQTDYVVHWSRVVLSDVYINFVTENERFFMVYVRNSLS
jgi:hypothetical protein